MLSEYHLSFSLPSEEQNLFLFIIYYSFNVKAHFTYWHICAHKACIYRKQKMLLGIQELDLQTVLNFSVTAGN